MTLRRMPPYLASLGVRRLIVFAVAAAVLILVALSGFFFLRARPDPPPAEVAHTQRAIRLALPLQLPSLLVFVADEEGFFKQQGLQVTLTEYVSGARALAAMLAGEADVTTAADVPVAVQSFTRQDFRILATISSSGDEQRIVARRDRGIATPADLRGKRVATQEASAVHFFLHCFLLKHGLRDQDIILSFQKAETLVPSLVQGTIDAFSMREPYVTEAVNQLGARAVVFHEPELYLRTEQLLARQAFLQSDLATLRSLVRALLQAETFSRQQPQTAMAIAARRLRTSPRAVTTLWPSFDFSVNLDQALVLIFENEARWAMHCGLTDRQRAPNYLLLINTSVLGSLKPDAVTIVR